MNTYKYQTAEDKSRSLRGLVGTCEDQRIIQVNLDFDPDSIPVDATVTEIHFYVNGVRIKVMRPYDRTASRMGMRLPNAY